MRGTHPKRGSGLPYHLDFLLSCAIIALVVGFFFLPEARTQQFWIGQDRGWLEILAPLGTVAAASAAAWLAWRNYRLGQQKESSERFEKGVGLFQSEGGAQRAAGIIVLEDLALTEPDGRRAGWVREFLVHALNEWNQAVMAPLARPIAPTAFETTPPNTLRALLAFARTRADAPEPVRLRNLYLSNCIIHRQELPLIVAMDGLYYDVDFLNSNMQDCTIQGSAFGSVTFESCDLRNTKLRFANNSSADIHIKDCDLSGTYIHPGEHIEMTLENCKLDGATIGGKAEINLDKCWFSDAPPAIRNISALTGHMGLYQSTGSTHRVTESGISIWEPSDDDQPVAKETVASASTLSRVPR